MMEDLRKISVMIPTFNRGEFICECIESVLSQGIHCSQIVIVDEGRQIIQNEWYRLTLSRGLRTGIKTTRVSLALEIGV